MLWHRRGEQREDELLSVHESACEKSRNHHGDANSHADDRSAARGRNSANAAYSASFAATCYAARSVSAAADDGAARDAGSHRQRADSSSADARRSGDAGAAEHVLCLPFRTRLLSLPSRTGGHERNSVESKHGVRNVYATDGPGERTEFVRSHPEHAFALRLGLGTHVGSMSADVRTECVAVWDEDDSVLWSVLGLPRGWEARAGVWSAGAAVLRSVHAVSSGTRRLQSQLRHVRQLCVQC